MITSVLACTPSIALLMSTREMCFYQVIYYFPVLSNLWLMFDIVITLQKMILGYLEQACAEFGSLAAECKALVEQYEPLVLKELQQLLVKN